MRTVIADPQAARRKRARPCDEHCAALRRAMRATRSASGKALLRKRDEHLERGFCHVLDHRRLRRATLRGCEKLTKREKTGALAHNLSVLLRHIFGVGTLKQALARRNRAFVMAIMAIWRLLCWLGARLAPRTSPFSPRPRFFPSAPPQLPFWKIRVFSTDY